MIAARSPSETYTDGVTAPRGVAWGADVAMFAVPAGSGGGTYRPVSLAVFDRNDDLWASLFTDVVDWSSGGRTLDFVNVSLGYPGIIEQYSKRQLRDNFEATITALAQSGESDKTVFVIAAQRPRRPLRPGGLYEQPGPLRVVPRQQQSDEVSGQRQVGRSLVGLPARITRLRGHVIAAVAVSPDSDDDGDCEIASYSNRCGIAARWCIAAPGSAIRVAYFGPHPSDGTPGARGPLPGAEHPLPRPW